MSAGGYGIIYNGSHLTDAVLGTRASALNRTLPANNKSGIKGVSWSGQHYHLGHYINIEDATQARARAESMHEDFVDWYINVYQPEIHKQKS